MAYPRSKGRTTLMPMRIQARQGSLAEKRYYHNSSLPGTKWPMPKAIAPGISPSPLSDLMFHGGKVVPQMEFQNIYLGGESSWQAADIELIDRAITRAMQDRRLNNVLAQYFPGATLSCDTRDSLLLEEPKPALLDEPDVQAKIVQLFDTGKIARTGLGSVLFNLILPRGSVLRLGGSNSLNGLGGYHGSVHIRRNGRDITLYYSANVFSETQADGTENGIDVFNRPWKNVVGTLYHELNEFRTDADVNDAIESGSNDFLGWTSRQGQEIGDQPIAVARPLTLVFREVTSSSGGKRIPVQLLYSNVVHGAEGPISIAHALAQNGRGAHAPR
jgi:hypothetical protein